MGSIGSGDISVGNVGLGGVPEVVRGSVGGPPAAIPEKGKVECGASPWLFEENVVGVMNVMDVENTVAVFRQT